MADTFKESILIPKAFLEKLVKKEKGDKKDASLDDGVVNSTPTANILFQTQELQKEHFPAPKKTKKVDPFEKEINKEHESKIQTLLRMFPYTLRHKISYLLYFIYKHAGTRFRWNSEFQMGIDKRVFPESNLVDILTFLFSENTADYISEETIKLKEGHYVMGIPRDVDVFLDFLKTLPGVQNMKAFHFLTSQLNKLKVYQESVNVLTPNQKEAIENGPKYVEVFDDHSFSTPPPAPFRRRIFAPQQSIFTPINTSPHTTSAPPELEYDSNISDTTDKPGIYSEEEEEEEKGDEEKEEEEEEEKEGDKTPTPQDLAPSIPPATATSPAAPVSPAKAAASAETGTDALSASDLIAAQKTPENTSTSHIGDLIDSIHKLVLDDKDDNDAVSVGEQLRAEDNDVFDNGGAEAGAEAGAAAPDESPAKTSTPKPEEPKNPRARLPSSKRRRGSKDEPAEEDEEEGGKRRKSERERKQTSVTQFGDPTDDQLARAEQERKTRKSKKSTNN